MKTLQNPETKSTLTSYVNLLVGIFLLCFYLLSAAGNIYSQRNLVFDDAFISYRYARNLANGDGITWNPNEAPVEGYTNFLLVLILAPFIKFGADPLLVTRILSIIAAIGMCILLYNLSGKNYRLLPEVSFLIVVSFLLFTNTDSLCIIGLETVLYTAAIFLSFAVASKYFENRNPAYGYFFGLACFITFLLRPEVVFLWVSFFLIAGMENRQKGEKISQLINFLLPVTIGFLLPFGAYLAWKYVYFGTIIPNPYYVKASSSHLFSPLGLQSVWDFIVNNRLWISMTALSFFITRETGFQSGRRLAELFCLIYLLFYLRVDTLMNVGDRFLYPIIIFLVYCSVPAISRIYSLLLEQKLPALIKIPTILSIIILALNPLSIQQIIGNLRAMRTEDSNQLSQNNSLMQKEYRMALALSKYAGIKQIRIAFGDAGVIPYFSEALSLDDVGLNDRFIAQETDINKLTDYYFKQKSELAILTSNRNQTWTTDGHGRLGNFSQWSNDSRWDEYAYVGTIRIDQAYDLQLFLRKDYANFDDFSAFLQQHVTEGHYEIFPLRIGNYRPENGTVPKWIPIASN